MAKIDITTLDGYTEEMTADEKLALFMGFDVPEPQPQGVSKDDYDKLKKAFDTSSTETAGFKKQAKELALKLDETKTEEQKKTEAQQEAFERLTESHAALEKKQSIAEEYAENLKLGYDEEMAMTTAIAMIEGEKDIVRANQKKFVELVRANERTRVLKETPVPPAGKVPKKKFSEMNYEEREEYYRNNPQK